MVRKLLEGLVFGAGSAVAFVIVGWLAVTLLFTSDFGPKEGVSYSLNPPVGADPGYVSNFGELSIEEKIEKSTVIALARFEPSADGRVKAVFSEFLKRNPDTEFYYKIGDEYPSAAYYPKEHVNYGDGLVIFFVGSPARDQMSMSYSGNRIRGLADIPIELFRDKCKKESA